MEFRAAKGMPDILPEEVARFALVEAAFRRWVELHGFSEVRTPILESTSLFARSTGETSEIVEKQMFSLARGSESFTLRPEGTPGVARAFLNNSVHAKEPVTRWYYIGPMFRAEQPQRGRQRQFYQAGCEVYGDPGPIVDAEIIDMLVGLLRDLGINDVEVRVNSIGGPVTRQKYREALLAHLTPRKDSLSEHAQKRLGDNPLRILDSKDPRDRAAVADAPSILDLLEPDDRAHWDGFRAALDALGTPYVVTPGLVRGLDYYTRTLFELVSNQGGLGSQNTLLGGGRYDGMVHELGGPKLPAVGFAIGLERLLLASPLPAPSKPPRCFIAPLGTPALHEALGLARELRAAGIGTDLDGRGGSMKSMLRRADSLGARVCLVLGDSEVQQKQVQVKDLAARTQQQCSRSDVVATVAQLLASAPPPPASSEAAR
jgi:histidyl-tRNA synthetase